MDVSLHMYLFWTASLHIYKHVTNKKSGIIIIIFVLDINILKISI